jgi:hypothetical protein
VPQKIGFFQTFGPELDGVAEGVHGLAVAADEGSTKVDVFEVVLFGLEVGDLADIVAKVWRKWLGALIFLFSFFLGGVRRRERVGLT